MPEVDITPDHTPCLGYEIVAARVFLHKLQIAVSGSVGTDIAQFCLYPIFIGQALLQTSPDKRV